MVGSRCSGCSGPAPVVETSLATVSHSVPALGSDVLVTPEVVANTFGVPVDGDGDDTEEVDWAL